MCPASQRADALNAITLVENVARLSTLGVFGFVFSALAKVGKAYITFYCNGVSLLLLPPSQPDAYQFFRLSLSWECWCCCSPTSLLETAFWSRTVKMTVLQKPLPLEESREKKQGTTPYA